MTNAATFLFAYYDTRPYLVWEGETILLPIESDDGGYRPRNKYNTGDSAWDEDNHERLASGGLEIDEELGGAIETNLPQLLTLSPERIRRELDTILKSEEGVYDLFETGILETIIPEYKGIYWGERHYDELPVITSVRNYG